MSEYEYDASGYFCSIAEEHGVKVALDAFMGNNPESYYAFSVLDDFNDQIEDRIEEIKKDLEREYDDPEDAFEEGPEEFKFIFFSLENDPGMEATISFDHVPTVAEDLDYIQEELLKQNELPTTYEEAWELAWKEMESYYTVTFTHDSVAADIDRYGNDEIISLYNNFKAYEEAIKTTDDETDIDDELDPYFNRLHVVVDANYSVQISDYFPDDPYKEEDILDIEVNYDWLLEHDIDPEDYDTTESAYEDIREAIIEEIDEEEGLFHDPNEDNEHAEEESADKKSFLGEFTDDEEEWQQKNSLVK